MEDKKLTSEVVERAILEAIENPIKDPKWLEALTELYKEFKEML